MFGKVSMDGSNVMEDKIIIPSSTIVGSDIKSQVYVVKEDKAFLQEIIIEKRIGDNAIVSEGISVGDVIVTGGFINLYEGAAIKTN